MTHDVSLADRADRVMHLQDGKFRRDMAARYKQVVDIGPDGRVALPREMLGEAMMSHRAVAEVVDEGILLNRESGE